jgi:iron-sulfur cluster repair protein YtfE (RIC family)
MFNADSAATQPADALIDHILTRYHAVYRAELPDLIALAERVGAVLPTIHKRRKGWQRRWRPCIARWRTT